MSGCADPARLERKHRTQPGRFERGKKRVLRCPRCGEYFAPAGYASHKAFWKDAHNGRR